MNNIYKVDTDIRAEIWAAKTLYEEFHKMYMETAVWHENHKKYHAAFNFWHKECRKLQEIEMFLLEKIESQRLIKEWNNKFIEWKSMNIYWVCTNTFAVNLQKNAVRA